MAGKVTGAHPDILLYGDRTLSNITEPVTVFDDALQAELAYMHQVMVAANGLGLAANQVGINKRMFTYQQDGLGMHIINPKILDMEDVIPSNEACLSMPGFSFQMLRWERVTVQGQDSFGETFEVFQVGDMAVVFQHEMDHLDGHLLIDHLDRASRRKVQKAMNAMYQ